MFTLSGLAEGWRTARRAPNWRDDHRKMNSVPSAELCFWTDARCGQCTDSKHFLNSEHCLIIVALAFVGFESFN
jgi:hypothetical protein